MPRNPKPPALTGRTIQRLIRAASKAREHAYAPYSGYRVGAALWLADGRVITGCNVENASYGLTVCAERGAIGAAVCAGGREFQAIAVVTANGGSPCGACRQALREFGDDIVVIVADALGAYRVTTVHALLPDSFDASHLTPKV